MEDAVFTFDTKSMKTAMDNISTSLSGLKGMIENMTTSVGKKTKKGIDDVTTGTKEKTKEIGTSLKTSVSNFSEGSSEMLSMVTKKVMGLATAYLSLRSVMKGVPEIGRVFSHAGDIITRSLFWPLRKQLLPLLQKILDWTRDHRVMFVKWGTMIANAFRSVYQIVLGVIKLVKTFVDSFMRTFEGLFGKITGRMSDTLNIIMFKLTAVFMYVLELIRPLIETLGSMIAKITYLFTGLWEGVKMGMKGLTPALEDLFKAMNMLGVAEGDLISKNGLIYKSFKNIGMVIGGIVISAIMALAQAYDTLGAAVARTTLLFKMWKAKDNEKEYSALKEERETLKQEIRDRTSERASNWAKLMKDLGKSLKENTLEDPEEDARIEKAGADQIRKIKKQIKKFKEEHPVAYKEKETTPVPMKARRESAVKKAPVPMKARGESAVKKAPIFLRPPKEKETTPVPMKARNLKKDLEIEKKPVVYTIEQTIKNKEKKSIESLRSSNNETTIKMSPINILVTNMTSVPTVGKDMAKSIAYSLEKELKNKLDRADSGVAH